MKLNNNVLGSDKRMVVDGVFPLGKHFLANPASSFVLDTIDNTGLVVALSFRRLRTAWTGGAVDVRRSNNNAVATIGFSGENYNAADQTTHLAGNDGLISSWLNQAGNGLHATQTTNANQPRVSAGGTAEVLGTRQAARLIHSSQHFLDISSIGSGSAATAIVVWSANSASPSGYDGPLLGNWTSDTTQGQHWPFTDGNLYDNFCHSNRSSAAISGWGITSPAITSIISQSGSYRFWFNNVLRINNATGNTTIRTASGHRIGRSDSPGGANYFNGRVSEIIIFKRALTDTERATIQTNQAAYYGITL
jgi:hypothetical protein